MPELLSIHPRFRPPLDPDFVPASLWNRAYRAAVRAAGGGEPLAVALERSDGSVSVFRTATLPHQGANVAVNTRYLERLLKFLLWQKGGYRVTLGGNPALAECLREIYAPGGARIGRAAGPSPGWLPHRLRPGGERSQMRGGGGWQSGLQRRGGVEPQ